MPPLRPRALRAAQRVATGLGLTTSAFLSRNLREWHKAARTLALQRLAVGAKFDRSVAARIAGAWTSWLSFSAKFGWMRRATGGFSRASQLQRARALGLGREGEVRHDDVRRAIFPGRAALPRHHVKRVAHGGRFPCV